MLINIGLLGTRSGVFVNCIRIEPCESYRYALALVTLENLHDFYSSLSSDINRERQYESLGVASIIPGMQQMPPNVGCHYLSHLYPHHDSS